MEHEELLTIAFGNPFLALVAERWSDIALKDAWVVAGAIAQTVWNSVSGFSPTFGISDIDIVYFDRDDLSEEAEQRHAERVRLLFPEVPLLFDVKNEARVHLWYEAKFDKRIHPYTSARDAIGSFPTTATAVGVQPGSRPLIYAPFGLTDLFNLIVRPNKRQVTEAVYKSKTERWLSLWPKLEVIPWDSSVRPS